MIHGQKKRRATVAKTLALIYLVIFLPLTLSITPASTTPKWRLLSASLRNAMILRHH